MGLVSLPKRSLIGKEYACIATFESTRRDSTIAGIGSRAAQSSQLPCVMYPSPKSDTYRPKGKSMCPSTRWPLHSWKFEYKEYHTKTKLNSDEIIVCYNAAKNNILTLGKGELYVLGWLTHLKNWSQQLMGLKDLLHLKFLSSNSNLSQVLSISLEPVHKKRCSDFNWYPSTWTMRLVTRISRGACV